MARPDTTRFVILVLVFALAPADALSPAGVGDRPTGRTSAPTEGIVTTNPPELGHEAKVAAPNPQPYATFGYDIAIEGDTFVTSAPFEDHSGREAEGAVYVFERDATGWSLAQKIIPPDWTSTFGRNIAMDTDTILVSDTSQTTSSARRAGAVYAYERVDGHWILDEKLEGKIYNAGLGSGLAIQGDTAFLGARPNHEVTGEIDPRTHVYERSNGTWERTQTLSHGPSHGPSIALSNDAAVIGGDFDSDTSYVYRHSDGEWTLSASLEDPTSEGASGYPLASSPNGYAWSADISGDRVLLGEFYERSAHVFVRTSEGWELETTLHPPGGASQHSGGSHYYGLNAVIEADLALVGAESEEMMAWQLPRLAGIGIVGERGIGGSDAGAVYVYERASQGWEYDGRLTARDAGADDAFGNALDLDGETAAIGAYADEHRGPPESDIVDDPDDGGIAAGSAYVFSPDADHDDVSDRAEGWLELDVSDPDTDGDGIDDGTEVTCGWDPDDPASPSQAGTITGPGAGDPVPLQEHKWWMCKVVGS